jgi:hypothetical protein
MIGVIYQYNLHCKIWKLTIAVSLYFNRLGYHVLFEEYAAVMLMKEDTAFSLNVGVFK